MATSSQIRHYATSATLYGCF